MCDDGRTKQREWATDPTEEGGGGGEYTHAAASEGLLNNKHCDVAPHHIHTHTTLVIVNLHPMPQHRLATG